jgi:hypothetical protein
MAKRIYWFGYAAAVCAGFAICFTHLLPVKSGGMFFLGILWVWRGVSLALRLNPDYAQGLERKDQRILAGLDTGMGWAWIFLSLTHLSEGIIPITLVSLPFLAASFVLFRRYRKK